MIFETLKMGFTLGRLTNDWPAKFAELYCLRDPAVHHRMEPRAAMEHPSGRSFVGRENFDYSLENACKSIDFAVEVISTAVGRPDPHRQAVVEWASRQAGALPDVLARRG